MPSSAHKAATAFQGTHRLAQVVVAAGEGAVGWVGGGGGGGGGGEGGLGGGLGGGGEGGFGGGHV